MQRRLIHTLATFAVQTSNLDTAEGLIRAIGHPSAQDHMTSGLAVAIAQAGDLDRAESMVQAITRLEVRARALGALATAIAQADDFDRATRLLAEAEAPALAVAKTGRTDVFTYLATVAAQIGDREYAAILAAHVEELNSHISNSDRKAQASRELAIVRATVGDLDRAETAAHSIMNTDVRTQALRQLATIIASAGDIQRAERIIQAITSPEIQVQALADLATAALTQDNPGQADQIISHAEAIARTDAYPGSRAYVFVQLAAGAAKFDLHRSQRLLAEAISTEPPSVQGWPEVMAQFFPASIRDAGDAFLAAYR
jgi:tetratricopeptide (TPR) repeat protein